jgi:hypothetical protein
MGPTQTTFRLLVDITSRRYLVYKGFAPSGKIAHLLFDSLKIICIFILFQELTTSLRSCLCSAHTKAKFQRVVIADARVVAINKFVRG